MANQDRELKSTPSSQSVPEMPEQVNVERVSNYDVYDATDQHIGSTSALWMDKYNQPAFIGIKTTRLFGKTHVIPAWGAEVNHKAERIRLPCPKQVVDDAPSFSPDEELDEGRERIILDYFRSKGACQPRAQATTPTAETAGPETATRQRSGETVIPLHEEEVKVGTRSVETGGVRLRKVIRTETVQTPVEVRHEEIQIERVPATGQRASEKAFQGEDIYIPLRREEPVVQKEAHVREEVRARKAEVAEKRTVTGEVRKEDVEVEKERRKAA
jgi:uncharacterized protein (TIGR02271 family)